MPILPLNWVRVLQLERVNIESEVETPLSLHGPHRLLPHVLQKIFKFRYRLENFHEIAIGTLFTHAAEERVQLRQDVATVKFGILGPI